MKPLIAVLAGTYNQYTNYIMSYASEDKRYIYATDADVIRRVSLETYVIVGTFKDRPDSEEILTVAQKRIIENSPQEPKMPDVTPTKPSYEKTVIRSLTLIVALILGSIVFGIGTCISFDRNMETLCMERGGSWSGVVGCYQPVAPE